MCECQKKYKNSIVFCKTCLNSFSFVDFPDHICTSSAIIQPLDKINSLQKKLDKFTKDLRESRTQIRFLQLKNHILENILKEHTESIWGNICKSDEDGNIHISGDGKIPIYVHENLENDKTLVKKYEIGPRHKSRQKREKRDVYRTISQIELVSERKEDIDKKVKEIDENIDDIIYTNFDISKKSAFVQFNEIFQALKDTRQYTKNLKHLLSLRQQLLGKLTFSEYIQLLESHKTILIDIFKSKYLTQSKQHKLISSAFSSLDARLISYGKYHQYSIDVDDIHRFRLALDITIHHPKEYVPLDKELLFSYFHNYSIVVFPIKEILNVILVNKYGFNNIIYISLPKSKQDDPYSFYVLDKVVGDIRHWKMECRLEEFAKDLSGKLSKYCIDLFRKIYFDVFHDNIYRQNYETSALIFSEDCNQLLNNLRQLLDIKSLRKLLISIIRKSALYKPTENDKFNLTGDDRLQHRRLLKEKSTFNYSVTEQLFEGINDDDKENFWVKLK